MKFEELAAPIEQIGEREFPIRAIKDIVLLDEDPWQDASFDA
jgi:hypothetical protein